MKTQLITISMDAKERISQQKKQYREQNREKIRLQKQEYYRKNHGIYIPKHIQLGLTKKEYKRLVDKAWIERNREHYLKHSKEYYQKNKVKWVLRNERMIKFKGKKVLLDHNPRIGKCSICHVENVPTNMHHFRYDDTDPLKYTIELCVPCHTKQHPRPRDEFGRFT